MEYAQKIQHEINEMRLSLRVDADEIKSQYLAAIKKNRKTEKPGWSDLQIKITSGDDGRFYISWGVGKFDPKRKYSSEVDSNQERQSYTKKLDSKRGALKYLPTKLRKHAVGQGLSIVLATEESFFRVRKNMHILREIEVSLGKFGHAKDVDISESEDLAEGAL